MVLENRKRTVSASHSACLVIGLHALLTAWIAAVHSPNWDEMAHLPSGLNHWKSGAFDLYRVNPPLVRMVAAIPVLFTPAQRDQPGGHTDSVYSRAEFELGRQFIKDNGAASFRCFTLARWAVIPLCLIGPWICFCWARELYGATSGIVAVVLYSFCPNMLAWGASITPDAAAASFGILSGYTFWRWLRDPRWPRALAAGAAMGLAELAKTTWIVLFVLWPLLWMIWRLRRNSPDGSQNVNPQGCPTPMPPLSQLSAILLVASYLINLGYGFEDSFKPLGEYPFISRALSGESLPPQGANRFAASWWAPLRVPFPANFVRGIDVQRFDFEQKKWSYLRGEQRNGGWWYYYLYGLLVKSPLGTLALVAISAWLAAVARLRNSRSGLLDELVLLAPPAAVLVLISSQTGFSRYLRYAVPALPFMYVAASRAAAVLVDKRAAAAIGVATVLAASVVESLWAFPHSQSFFNSVAGGPRGGHAHLLDANIDWGQDLLFLKRWYDSHPYARPFFLAFFGGYAPDSHVSGMQWEPIPLPGVGSSERGTGETTRELPAGWYAVSANHLWGYRHFEADRPVYTHFQHREPVAHAGYSILIYRVPEADGTRR